MSPQDRESEMSEVKFSESLANAMTWEQGDVGFWWHWCMGVLVPAAAASIYGVCLSWVHFWESFFFFCNNNTITLSTEGQHFCFFKTVGLHSINSTWILVPMPGPHVCLTSLVHLKLWSRSGRRLPGMPSIISSSHHQDAPSLPHACTCRVVHIEIELVKTVWQRIELKRSVKCPV